MKNSPIAAPIFTFVTTPAGSLSLALCVALASQGAWSASCPAKPACTVNQSSFGGNIASGQSLCITGTYTGTINNLPAGATIYVPAGATFNPSNFQNPTGSVINCGTASLPSLTVNTGFTFSNYGTAEFKSNINWNGKANFFNDAGAKVSFKTTFALKGNSSVSNDGEILSSGDFASEPGTSITNTGYIRISGGNFNPDGIVVNSGFVQTDEFININPSSELINNCSFISQKGFNNNSAKTRNNGYIFVTGSGNNNDLVQNNKPFSQGPDAVVVGTRFFNSAAITGGGKYYFTGDTRNQASFGDDGGKINFYDTTRTTGKIFDVQSPAPGPTVTSNAFTPPKVDAVVPSCSKNVAPVKPVITINIIAGDDIINSIEDDSAVTISGGTTDAPNDSVVNLSVNGKNYTAKVNNNSWSILVPALDVQAFDATELTEATVTLPDNSASSEKTTRSVAHVTDLPKISIAIVAGDDIINSTEDDVAVLISGTTTGAENDSIVSAQINNKKYTATVQNNSWSFNLPAADAQALKADEIITATVTNTAGNTSLPATRPIKHSQVLPVITIGIVAGDDIINANEDDAPVIISGTTTEAKNNSTVNAQLNGKSYTASVTDNTWSFNLSAADAQALKPNEQITATVTNTEGNISVPAIRPIKHSDILPNITISVVAGDDIINAQEDDSAVTIQGTTTSVENNSVVSVQLNGKGYSAVVINNAWSFDLPALDAQALKPSETINAVVTNAAGNRSVPALRPITHSSEKPTITIKTIAGDDIINLTEDDAAVVISGTTTQVENGQKVTLDINGKTYSASVTNNTWSTSISAGDAQALDATELVDAHVSNVAGDLAQANRTIKHSKGEPSVDIDVIAGDDIINTEEDNSPVLISGTTSLVENDQKVSINLNGKNYTGSVNNDHWQISIPAPDAQALHATERVTATTTNLAGDKSEPASRDIQHSLADPTIVINVIAGDDIINTTEDDAPVNISGKSTLIEDGQSVSLIINGKNYSAAVSNNTWSTSIPAGDAQALKASEKVTATASNKAGDKADADRTVTHSLTSPTVVIDVIAGDDIINAVEDDAPVWIKGITTLVEDGAKVSISVNGKTYEATVTNNTWSVAMPALDAQALGASEKVTASVINKAGDKATADRSVTHSGTTPTVTINVIAGDDIINTTEDDAPVIISGKTTLIEDGQSVSLIINGKNYTAAVSNNTWSTSIPAGDAQALKASEKVTASASNKAGDKADADRTVTHSLISPTVIIDVIAGDDIINAAEDDAPVWIKGTTTLVEDGAKVSISVNGKTYEAIVSNNAWSVAMPALDAQALGASEKVTSSVTNKAGDKATADRSVAHSGTTPTVTINVIAGDDIINTTEDDASVIISGKTTLIEDGQTVSLIINGKNYTAAVNNNIWSTSIPSIDAQALKASEKVTATASNKAGDKADADRTVTHSLISPTVIIDVIAGDDIINTTEDDAPVIISGKTTLIEDGQTVSLIINGKNYSAAVSNNTWSTSIPAGDAQALKASEKVTATASNKAGDKADADRTVTHSLTSPTVVIDVIAGDDVINATEDDLPVVVSGKTTLIEDGQKVTLSINGKNYLAVVSNNTWATSIPALDAQALKASEKTTASVTNIAGDNANAERVIAHTLTLPTLSINPVAGDDIINASEDDSAVLISGATTLVEDGEKVALIINGKTYSAPVANNTWSVLIPAADAQALHAQENVNATVANRAGDEAQAERAITHTLTQPTLSINPVAGDDIINSLEDDAPVLITGTTTLVEDGAKVSITINDKPYTAVVTDNAWVVEIPVADVQALDATETIIASVTNKAGDKADANKIIGHSVDTPTITINTIAGDDIINTQEDNAPVLINGTTTLVEDGQVLRLVINGVNYDAPVSNNTWSVTMPALDAQALHASETVTAVVMNKAGDKAEGLRSITHSINSPNISINPIAGDDIINAQEDDAPVLINGTTSLVEDGAKIQVEINGKTYDAIVKQNTWQVPIPVADVQALNPTEQVTASVTNKAGDSAEAERSLIHSASSPTISIEPIADDDIINTTEDDSAVLISGTTARVEDGQTLTLSVNGKQYPAVVSDNTWFVLMPIVDAQALPASNTASAHVTNLAGDPADASRAISHITSAPTVSINPVASDDIINATEDDSAVIVSGSTEGVADNTPLVVTVNGKNYTTTVQNNQWSTSMPALDAQALEQSSNLVAKVTTEAGDKAEASKLITHIGSGAAITLAPITGDNLISSLEDNGPITIHGTTSGVENGSRVTFELNDAQYEALVNNNQWSFELPQAAAEALKSEDTAHAEVTNALGDRAETTAVVHHVAWEDSDGDGLSDDVEGTKDTDGDGVPDYLDIDSDNDGILDEDEIRDTTTDTNHNGIPDSFDAAVTQGPDSDGDGIDDRFDAEVPGKPKGVDKNEDGITDNAPVRDSDGDGLPDYIDIDSDNDAVPDLYEAGGSQYDTNGDGRADGKDTDGDGLLDVFDPSQGNQPLKVNDADNDGIPDILDLDSDNDGLPDINEDAIGVPDPDGDGIISSGPFIDSDHDGLGDAADIDSGGKLGVRLDSDFNGSSDGQSTDRDGDGISDLEESVGKTQAQLLDPDGDGRIGTGAEKPTDSNNNGIPDAAEINLAGAAVKDTNGNGISDGIEEQLTHLHVPVPATNAQTADFDRDGYPDWMEVRYGGNPLDNAEADSNGNGVPDWVENTDLLLDNQNDTDADGFADLLEQVQGTPVDKRNSSDELFNAALKTLLNPSRYEGRSLKPVIWVDMKQGRQAVASLGNLAGEGAFNGDAQFSVKIGNYHVFGDPRDPQTVPVYDWTGTSPEILALADDSHGAALSFDPTRLSAGQYQVTASVTLAGHTSRTVQRFVVGASPTADQDRDHLADSQDQQDANLGLLQAIPAQNTQLLQAAAITLANNQEQLDHALRLRLGAVAQATNAGQALLTPQAFSQYGTAIGNSKYTTQSNETFTYAQVYDLEVTNLPSVGGMAEVVIPLAQPIDADLHLQRFNPLTGWQAFSTTGGDEIATAAAGADGLCPAPGSSLYEPGLNGGDSCLLVRVTDGGLNDGDNNDTGAEDGQGDVNGLIQLGLTLAQDTAPNPAAPTPAKQGKIQTGLKGKGGSLGWLFLAFTPSLLIFRRRKTHDQAR